jgi:hypothetical protein
MGCEPPVVHSAIRFALESYFLSATIRPLSSSMISSGSSSQPAAGLQIEQTDHDHSQAYCRFWAVGQVGDVASSARSKP